ncbi:MAG: DMT family transporter [Pseudomonadota bacterium]
MRPSVSQASANPSLLLWLALFGIGVAWGSSQYFSKVIVTEGHHPLGISFASTLLGAVLATGFLLARGNRLPLDRRHLVYYLVCGLTGTALPNYTSYASMRELPLGVISIVIAAVPIMTFLAAVALRMDRPEFRRVAGLVMGAIAVLILIVPETSLPEPEDAIWVGVSLITCLAYTIENIYIARYQPPGTTALQTLCGLSWGALLLITPLVTATGLWMELDTQGWAESALVAMTLAHLLAYGGFVWLIAQAGPVFAAQVGYVVTLTGVAMGMVLLGEAHSVWVWASLVLMMAGLALVQPRHAQSGESTVHHAL